MEQNREHTEGRPDMAPSALVLLSGGLDSAVLLASLVERYGPAGVVALSLSYGQKHQREAASAQALAQRYGVELYSLDLSSVFAQSNSSLLEHSSEDIPTKSYAEQQETAGALVSTYVPFRNGLFLSAAASFALSLGCSELYYGAHADDAAGEAYPDCSAEFVEAMDAAIRLGTAQELCLEAPFARISKAQIVQLGLRLDVPFELTWSCYEGGDTPCGTCATCIDRARAFAANNAEDPVLICR